MGLLMGPQGHTKLTKEAKPTKGGLRPPANHQPSQPGDWPRAKRAMVCLASFVFFV